MPERRPLRDFVTLQRGQSYKGGLVGLPGPHLLGLGTIERNGGFRADLLRTYGGDAPQGILLGPGDLYVSLKDVTHAADLLGAVARVPDFIESARLTQDTIRLDVDDRAIDRDFLYWQLRAPAYRAYCRTRGTGTTNLDLSRDDFLSYVIVVPDRLDQRAIAEVLGALDDKIAANTRLATTADELIAAMHLRAVGNPGTRAVRLLEALDVRYGEPFSGEQFSEPGVGRPLIRIRDLRTFTSQVWTTEVRNRETLVQPGDVVVGMDAEFRPTAWLGEPGMLNQRVCRVTSTAAGPAFVREALREPLADIEGYKSGTTVIHLNKADLERHDILLPPSDALGEFERSAEPVYAHRVASAAENRTLAATRDALLPALMSGALRVRDAERVASELT